VAPGPTGGPLGREELIERHLPLAQGIARRYSGRGESFDDLAQVGAIGLIKAVDRFQAARGVPFGAFATLVVEGEIRRHLRDRRRALAGQGPAEPDGLAAPAPDEVAAAAPDPFAASDDRSVLGAMLRGLDDRDRQITYLRFHAELSEARIAQELGISQSQVSRRLRRTLRRLEAELPADIAPQTVISPKSDPAAAPPGALSAGAGRPTLAPMPVDDVAALEEYLDRPYHIAVSRAEHDDGDRPPWIASVEELSGCVARGRTPDEAVQRLRSVMEEWVSGALAEGREIPAPRAAPTHSGRLLLRMPPTLHAELARAADSEGVSLNQRIVDMLTDARAERQAGEPSRPIRVALIANLVVVGLAAIAAVVLLLVAWHAGL
jgi:RNA polymerase sigma-B factor